MQQVSEKMTTASSYTIQHIYGTSSKKFISAKLANGFMLIMTSNIFPSGTLTIAECGFFLM